MSRLSWRPGVQPHPQRHTNYCAARADGRPSKATRMRITVRAPGDVESDLELDPYAPVGEVIQAAVSTLLGREVGTATRTWRLEGGDGRPFAPESTLAREGVVDGDVLTLTKASRRAPPGGAAPVASPRTVDDALAPQTELIAAPPTSAAPRDPPFPRGVVDDAASVGQDGDPQSALPPLIECEPPAPLESVAETTPPPPVGTVPSSGDLPGDASDHYRTPHSRRSRRATAVMALAGTAIVAIAIGVWASRHAGTSTPTIARISPVRAAKTQTITISGNGFGHRLPFDGDDTCIEVEDTTQHWNAGHRSPTTGAQGGACNAPFRTAVDTVTLNVTTWNSTTIVISGFSGQYGVHQYEYALRSGDNLLIKVWNAQTGAGPATTVATVVA